MLPQRTMKACPLIKLQPRPVPRQAFKDQMKIFVETQRLLLRELMPSDEEGMFVLDSDAEVHRYLGNKPISSTEQARKAIETIRQQYRTHGIGRWAVVEKTSEEFIGWAGLKFLHGPINGHTDFYELGYRLIRNYWGLGYATEAACAALDYGFETMMLDVVYGMTMKDNSASRKVMDKVGFIYVDTFDLNGDPHAWYERRRK